MEAMKPYRYTYGKGFLQLAGEKIRKRVWDTEDMWSDKPLKGGQQDQDEWGQGFQQLDKETRAL